MGRRMFFIYIIKWEDPQRECGMPFPEEQYLEMQTKPMHVGTYLVVQWLRCHAPTSGDLSSIPGQGTRFHMLQLRACMPQLSPSVCVR